MAASQIHSSSTSGFSKYPELPTELRLQIIEDWVIAAYKPWEMSRRLAEFAAIDSQWNRIVERVLFRNIGISHKDLIKFGKICGKRQELLKRITFSISDLHHPELTLAMVEKLVAGYLSQLFHVMKDWSRADRGPHDQIKLLIHVAPWLMLESTQDLASSLCCDFTSLPEVSVIGTLRANQRGWSKYQLHDSALDSLHEKLLGLQNAKLEIPCRALPQETINDASNRIIAFHAIKPSLAKLSIFHRDIHSGRLVEHGNRITITEALTPQVSLWSNSLVCLKLNSVMDIAQFLLTASGSVWLRLHRLDLTGFLDQDDGSSERAVDDREQASSDLLRGLIAALPSMRNLTRIGVRLRDLRGPIRWHPPCLLGMDLTPKANTEWPDWVPGSLRLAYPSKDPIVPCGSLPTSVSGIIKAHHVALAGHLVKELQDTVWQQRRLDLAVFCCKEHPERGFFEPGPSCTQWNKETDSWDPAFKNDMDVLIYDMGQYWLQT
ncbi:hypothetical protein INS49_015790 [Diaporthe citri]|uniref:uncharacterized protein n=1 Tax=Diaporthe citri TaxID=83186 RepID=UPI001C7F0AD5|nr:uncharacterized protein INS49_015790 [Diaporthe citri]KAG6356402.1 hypothetical protein INS49_015790 [Diaporthe citri]